MRIALFVIISLFSAKGYGQADKSWIVGSPVTGVRFEIDSSIKFATDSAPAPFRASANICNEQGELQFMTDGVNIYESSGHLMEGGYRVGDSVVCNYFSSGLPVAQTVLILPRKDKQFYVFRYSIDDNDSTATLWIHPTILEYSVVDMSYNNGKGKVIVPYATVDYQDFGDSRLTACRHGNGRDWWLVAHGYNDNRYIKYLITPDHFEGPFVQNIGAAMLETDAIGQAEFSPDGTKYVSATANSPVVVLDFDRCSGQFSNPMSIVIPNDSLSYGNGLYEYSISGATGLSFSPSGRFLYVTLHFFINQYDLSAADVPASAFRVYTHSFDVDTFGKLFNQEKLLPNGKIAIANWNGGTGNFSIINQPDSQGSHCGFSLRSLVTTTISATILPNMIQYKLGRATDWQCDTLFTGVNELRSATVKVNPNPVTSSLIVSIDDYLPNAILEIRDIGGRIIFRNPNFYIKQEIDARQWAAGIYFVSVFNDNKSLVNKVVK